MSFRVGDRIISTCGSNHRGCEGTITEFEDRSKSLVAPYLDDDGMEYHVTISTPMGDRHCGFCASQMILAADPGRDHDTPCQRCCCTLGGLTPQEGEA